MKYIKLFEELLDPELLSRLDIKNIDNSLYFYENKEINKTHYNELFESNVFDIVVSGDNSFLLINMNIKWKSTYYEVPLYYDTNDQIFYIISKNHNNIKKLKLEIGNVEMFNKLNEFTEDILNKYIPLDFWKVRSKSN